MIIGGLVGNFWSSVCWDACTLEKEVFGLVCYDGEGYFCSSVLGRTLEKEFYGLVC